MKLIRTFLIALAACGLVLGSATVASAQEVRIAYVDLQRALNEVEDGQAARTRLERDFERRQEEINERQEELQEFQQELAAGFEMLEPEAQQERLQEYQQKLQELQEMFARHQRELAESEMEATSEIFERMLRIIAEIAEERDYTLVLEKSESSILFAADGMEFTDELISRYNSRH